MCEIGENGNTPLVVKLLTTIWPATACAFTVACVPIELAIVLRYGRKISWTFVIVGETRMYLTSLADLLPLLSLNQVLACQSLVPLTEYSMVVPAKEVVPKFHFCIVPDT